MLSTKDKAVTSAEETASTNNRYSGSYRNSVFASRAKLQIGTLLLALQTTLSQQQREKTWHIFELKLWRYIDLKYCEVPV